MPMNDSMKNVSLFMYIYVQKYTYMVQNIIGDDKMFEISWIVSHLIKRYGDLIQYLAIW